jgi:hypothetical protein
MATKLYEQAAPAGQPPGAGDPPPNGGPPPGASGGDGAPGAKRKGDVIDAEFEEGA